MIVELTPRAEAESPSTRLKEVKKRQNMGSEEFQPKSFSKVYSEFHIDKAK